MDEYNEARERHAFLTSQAADLQEAATSFHTVVAELDELMTLSDRILVIYEGEIIAEGSDFTEKELGLLISGQKTHGAGNAAAM